jgi:hypothetical protein
VEQGKPVPLNAPHIVPKVPKSPECYANAHSKRINDFPEEDDEELVDPRKLKNQSQDDGWRHELDHDVESVLWLLLYWAMVMQPAEGPPGGYINAHSWTGLLGNFNNRGGLLALLSSRAPLLNLTHSVYEPLCPLISDLAAILVVDRHWLPESNVRKSPKYICEAFQRLILQFIDSNHNEDFMTCRVHDTLRQVKPEVVLSQAPITTPTQRRDGLEREIENEPKRRRLDRTEVVYMCHL